MVEPVRDPGPMPIRATGTAPVSAGTVLLCAFCLVVPIIIWNGLPTAIAVKEYFGRIIILLMSIPAFLSVFDNKQTVLPSKTVMLSAFLFCLFISVNSLFHRYHDPAVLQNALFSFLLFFEVLFIAKSDKEIRAILYCLCASGGIVGLYFTVQKLGLDFLSWQLPDQSWMGSTFSNRNLMVYFIICVFPFNIYLLRIRSKPSRILVGASTALMFFALIACYSRTAIVIVALSVPAYLLYAGAAIRSQKTRSMAKALSLILFACLIAGACILGYHAAKLPLENINVVSHYRIRLWMDTMRLIADAPLVGHGVGSFARIFPAFQSDALGYLFSFEQPIFFSHNEILEILVESGVIGLALFAFTIIVCLSPVVKNGLRSVRATPLVFFSCVSLSSCFVFSLVGEACHMFICSAFSWIVLAIAHSNSAAHTTIPSNPLSKSRTLFRIMGVALSVGIVIALASIARSFLSDMYLQRAIFTVSQSGRQINPVDALPDIETSLKFNGRNLYARYQLAYVKTMQKDLSQALALYADIQKVYPFFENTQYNKGIIYFQQKDYRKAIDTLTVTLRRYPTFKDGLFSMACSFFELGDWINCESRCAAFKAQDSTNARINMMAAWSKKEMNVASPRPLSAN